MTRRDAAALLHDVVRYIVRHPVGAVRHVVAFAGLGVVLVGLAVAGIAPES